MSEKLTYHWEDDYMIPDLIPPESPCIGIWGERRRIWLRTVRRPIYTEMLFSGTLNAHLEDIDRTAEEMIDRLMTQMADREGITEQLKEEDQMTWVQCMNSIRHRVEEIVFSAPNTRDCSVCRVRELPPDRRALSELIHDLLGFVYSFPVLQFDTGIAGCYSNYNIAGCPVRIHISVDVNPSIQRWENGHCNQDQYGKK